jgi:hypothetical protein
MEMFPKNGIETPLDNRSATHTKLHLRVCTIRQALLRRALADKLLGYLLNGALQNDLDQI